MTMNEGLIAELQMEAASTKKMLERVPIDKNDWKPHEKSMKLGRLASHVAELPGWIAMTMATDELDLSKMDYKPTIANSTEELVGILDSNVDKATTALKNAATEDFHKCRHFSPTTHQEQLCLQTFQLQAALRYEP